MYKKQKSLLSFKKKSQIIEKLSRNKRDEIFGKSSNGEPMSSKVFWDGLKPYFNKIGREHIELLEPLGINEDPCFIIPKILSHYRKQWFLEDYGNTKINRKFIEEDNQQQIEREQQLEHRLVSVLTESSSHPHSNQFRMEQKEKEDDKNFPGFISMDVEERLMLELQSIGLIDTEVYLCVDDRQDDEICIILRHLQKMLLMQIMKSNEEKKKLLNKVKEYQKIEEKKKKKIDEDLNIEKLYKKRLKQWNKRKKRKK